MSGTRANGVGALPESFLEQLRSHRGAGDAGKWQIGDAIETFHVEAAGRVTLRRLYRAAAVETERSIADVRMLHETARASDEQLRGEFDEPLVFAHFREVRYLGDRVLQVAYLKWCIESADDYGGRPAPASILRRKIQRERGTPAPPPTVAELFGRCLALVDKVLEVYETDAEKALAEQVRALLGRYG